MKILADQHISPRTVEFLKGLGHDAVRVSERLPRNAPDFAILDLALAEGRVVLSQDLDFTGLICDEWEQFAVADCPPVGLAQCGACQRGVAGSPANGR